MRLSVLDRRPSPPGRLRPLAFNTGLNFVSQVVLAASLLLTSVLTSRALGRSDRGLLALLVLTPVILHLILDLGVEQGLTVTAAKGSLVNSDRRSILRGLVVHGVLGAAVASVVVVLAPLTGGSSLSALGGPNAPLTVAACLLAVLQRDLTGLLSGHQRVAFVSVSRMAGALAVAVGSAILYASSRRSLSEYFTIYVGGMACVVALMGLRLHRVLPRAGSPAVGSVDWRLVAKTGFPYYGATLTYFAVSRFDLLLLGATRPPAELGLYSNAVNLAEVIWYFPSALGQVLLPYTRGRGNPHLCRKTVVLVLVLSMMAALILGLIGEFLISFLFGPEFVDAITPLLLLLPGAVGMSCVHIGIIWLLIYGRARMVLAINASMASIGAILWWITVPRFGMNAAAAVSSALYCSMGLTCMTVLARTIRSEPSKSLT